MRCLYGFVYFVCVSYSWVCVLSAVFVLFVLCCFVFVNALVALLLSVFLCLCVLDVLFIMFGVCCVVLLKT